MKIHSVTALLIIFFIGFANGQYKSQTRPTKEDSLNGSITQERIWWDILRYELTVKPNLKDHTLTGKNTIKYKVVSQNHSKLMQIDLVKPLMIDSILQNNKKLKVENKNNFWYAEIVDKQSRKNNEITIYYSGKPTVSVNPPWDGGVVWEKDSLNRPTISVACQYKGASLWFPCKNALYDEPDDGVSISVIVPNALKGISNGRLTGTTNNNDGTTTYHWNVVNPISHYAISFYIGNYINIKQTFSGRKGNLDTGYWVLDYNEKKAYRHMLPEVNQTLKSLEKWFGPYPFYKDSFKMIDAPYIGMEHQSAIAYGGNYVKGTNKKGMDISKTGWGKKTDRTIVHEIGHEWFGNSITASDIADRWLQEGFAGLAEELVIADLCGRTAGEEFMQGRFRTIENDKPIIGRYGINEDGSQDNYMKGWALLHMIKTITDDDKKFARILNGMSKKYYHKVVNSNQIENYINKKSKRNFDILFDQYLRTAQQPVLEYKISNDRLEYRFINCNPNFSLPLKTNWTVHQKIIPTIHWQSITIDKRFLSEEFTIDKNFLIVVKKLN